MFENCLCVCTRLLPALRVCGRARRHPVSGDDRANHHACAAAGLGWARSMKTWTLKSISILGLRATEQEQLNVRNYKLNIQDSTLTRRHSNLAIKHSTYNITTTSTFNIHNSQFKNKLSKLSNQNPNL